MTFEEYQRLAQKTSSRKLQLIDKIENGLMGLNGEAGEAIDILKKHKFQGHSLDQSKIIEELGDVLWYIAETCEGLGVPMEKVARLNIEKLKKRYPEGFSSERSINRKLNNYDEREKEGGNYGGKAENPRVGEDL